MFFIGDQLCSHSRALTDLMTAVCLAVDNPISPSSPGNLSCLTLNRQSRFIAIAVLLPLAARALQCLRRFVDVSAAQGMSSSSARGHAFNCFKYLLGILVAATHNNLHVASEIPVWWLALACSSTAYSFWWDVSRDWGLACNLCDMKHAGLRQDLLLLPHWFRRGGLYYIAVAFNFLARGSSLIAVLAFPRALSDLQPLVLGLIEVHSRQGLSCGLLKTFCRFAGEECGIASEWSGNRSVCAPGIRVCAHSSLKLHCCGGEWRPVRDLSMQYVVPWVMTCESPFESAGTLKVCLRRRMRAPAGVAPKNRGRFLCRGWPSRRSPLAGASATVWMKRIRILNERAMASKLGEGASRLVNFACALNLDILFVIALL